MTREQQTETGARALFDSTDRDLDGEPGQWEELTEAERDQYKRSVGAVIDAIHPTVRTVIALAALPVGSVVHGHTTYLKVRSMRGFEVWGCVGTPEIIPSAEILEGSGGSVTVLHMGDTR